MEFTLLFAALTGVGFAWITVRAQIRRGELAGVERPADTLIGAAGVGVFSGRIVEMLLAGVNPITNPFDVLLVRGGVSTVAASAVAVGTVAWAHRHELEALDGLAPAALAGLAGWHAGCVWTGSCLGAATDLGWGLTLPGSDVPRHPTEIYATLILIVGAFVVARMSGPLRATGTAVAVAGLARLITEPLRPSITGGPVAWYALALAGGLAVAFLGPRWLDRNRLSGEPSPPPDPRGRPR